MKRLLFAVAAVLLATSAPAQDKNQETIEGNGKSITRDVTVSSFGSLKASGIFELLLSQGDKESVKIEADENLQEYFNVRNDGDKLIIDMDKIKNKNLKNANKIKVYVTFRKLSELELNMVGNTLSEEQLSFEKLDMKNKSLGTVELQLTASRLELENKSVGNVTLEGKVDDVVVKNKGVGELEAGKLVVQTMDIENNSVGNAEVNAEKSLKVKDSFLGKVKNKGAAQPRRMNKVRV